MADLLSDIGDALGGAASAIGGPLVGGGLSLLGSLFQQDFSSGQANSVYQRGVKDMEAAGLNPILAAGAPDPMAVGQNWLGSAVSSAQSLAETQQSMQLQNAQQGLVDLQQRQTGAQTGLTQASAVGVNLANVGAKLEAEYKKDHPNLTKIGIFLDTLLGPLIHAGAEGVRAVK